MIEARVPVTFWSRFFEYWGENIYIDFLREGALRIRSECALASQLFDWGKNRNNITRFLETFETILRIQSADAENSENKSCNL